MNEAQPLITVITATLNSSQRLPRCIASIARQTYPRRELVVMDGGSTDGTLDILRAATHVVAYWESSPDKGIFHAWNKALPHALGEWICLLGADDYLWSPDSLKRVVQAAAARRPQTRLLYGQVAVVNQSEEVLSVVGGPWRLGNRASLRWLPLPYPAVFHHRSVFAEFGTFDDTFHIAGDWDMLVRVMASADVEFLPEVLVGMEVGGISSVPDNELAVLREIARIWRKHRLALVPTPDWWWAYAKASVRLSLRRAMGERAASQVLDAYRRAKGQPAFWTRR